MNRHRVIFFAGIAVLLGAPFVLPLLRPWSRINCRDVEIDLATGEKRTSRYFYGIPVTREISETRLSSELSELEGPANWVPVSRFGPYGGHSPHYVYHSATAQIQQLALIWDLNNFDESARQATATGLLLEWRTTGSDSSADDYLRRISADTKALE